MVEDINEIRKLFLDKQVLFHLYTDHNNGIHLIKSITNIGSNNIFGGSPANMRRWPNSKLTLCQRLMFAVR